MTPERTAEILAGMAAADARYAFLPGWRRCAPPPGREHEPAPRGWAYHPPMVYLRTADEAAHAIASDYHGWRTNGGALGTMFMRDRMGGLTHDVDASDDGPALRIAISRAASL